MVQVAVAPTHLTDVLPGEMLLATKLYAPPARPPGRMVSRPRLLEQLDQGLAGRLILVSAPAGFGKTTVLSEWIADRELRVAWVSLDGGDSDPVCFGRYIVAALQAVAPQVGKVAADWLRAPQPPPLESVLTLLINDLCLVSEELVLVLDDYHTLDAGAVHQAVAFLLDRLPPSLHLVIATRADPPLPLSRWRSRGQMAEVRADDLRFTSEETREFFGRVMGLGLSSDEIATLEECTEGWIVGLQMAALSLRGRENASAFVQAFSGSHRYVLDYLVAEVIDSQLSQVQQFLLQTSILDRLSGPLCEAITGQGGGQSMLERLESANLFLVPLDDERRWYRYHHLFAELLCARLQQAQPDIVATLHLRAAKWHRHNGSATEAVHHALAAGEFTLAANWIESALRMGTAWSGEGISSILAWLKRLPDQVVYDRPWLRFYALRAAYAAGQFDQAERLLQGLIDSVEANPSSVPDSNRLLGAILETRASHAMVQGYVRRAIDLAHQSLACLPEDCLLARAIATYVLGLAHALAGDVVEASQVFRQAMAIALASKSCSAMVTVAWVLADTQIVQGQLRQAVQTCNKAIHSGTIGGLRVPASGLAGLSLAEIFRERNELQEAEHCLMESLELLRQGQVTDNFGLGHALLACIKQALGNTAEAQAAIEHAVQIAEESKIARVLVQTSAHQVRIWLRQGELSLAAHWADGYNQVGATEYLREFEDLTLARVLIAGGKLDEAVSILSQLAEAAEAAGRNGRLIEILAILALALHQQNRTAQAIVALEKSFALAEPEGYMRVFLDEGASMAMLLRQAARRGIAPSYVSKLLTAFEEEQKSLEKEREAVPPVPSLHRSLTLVEPLSDRELEVLRLVADGLSNQEVADALILAVGTVKAHVHTIYGKLGVQSRTQAIARAKELHLL
jgi:LuxR family maltose regulon positive regulatory protein